MRASDFLYHLERLVVIRYPIISAISLSGTHSGHRMSRILTPVVHKLSRLSGRGDHVAVKYAMSLINVVYLFAQYIIARSTTSVILS